jgi:ABC-type uncharacterized transport system substrate-binding protein
MSLIRVRLGMPDRLMKAKAERACTRIKILRGTKLGDIPVEQPTKFDLIINRTPAKALGLTIPETPLATADRVIE